MRSLGIAFCLTVLLTACSNKVNQFTLMNATSLDGWHQVGAPVWRTDDNSFTVYDQAGDSFLLSIDAYDDFELRIDFWIEEGVNSGVFIRCQSLQIINPDNCYEINIWDAHPKQEYRTGSIVKRFAPPLAHINSVGQWNQMVIIAKGDQLKVKINGTTTAKHRDTEWAGGHIALQRFGQGMVRFRNLFIRQEIE